jgi:hypothetical protein
MDDQAKNPGGAIRTMATAAPAQETTGPTPPIPYDYFAAFLSYLIPGLGQLYQGRLSKGLLFMVSLLGMFVFGMYLGDWQNVYLLDTGKQIGEPPAENPVKKIANWTIDRIRFVGQFPIGVAAWPAILQYNNKWFITEKSNPWHSFQRTPSDEELNNLQRKEGMGKKWDLGWVYTVIAGVLNVLVIYDALAGPAFARAGEQAKPTPAQETAIA